MRWSAQHLVTIAVIPILSLFLSSIAARAQEQPPPAPPAAMPRAIGSAEQKGNARDELTGDWGGVRPWLNARGITIEGNWIQFY